MKRTRKRRCHTGILACDITKEQLAQWFHLPSHEACTQLGISLSVLKRVCQKLGIPRWPYRSLTSSIAGVGQAGLTPHYSSPSRPSTPPHPSTLIAEEMADMIRALPANKAVAQAQAMAGGGWGPPSGGYAGYRNSKDLHVSSVAAAAQLVQHAEQGPAAFGELMGLEPQPGGSALLPPENHVSPQQQTSSKQLQEQPPAQEKEGDSNGLQSLLAAVAAMDPRQPRKVPRLVQSHAALDPPLPQPGPPSPSMLSSGPSVQQLLRGSVGMQQAQRVPTGQASLPGTGSVPPPQQGPGAHHHIPSGSFMAAPQPQGPELAWGPSSMKHYPSASRSHAFQHTNTLPSSGWGREQQQQPQQPVIEHAGRYTGDYGWGGAGPLGQQHANRRCLSEEQNYSSMEHSRKAPPSRRDTVQGLLASRLALQQQQQQSLRFDPGFQAQYQRVPPGPSRQLAPCAYIEHQEHNTQPWSWGALQDERAAGGGPGAPTPPEPLWQGGRYAQDVQPGLAPHPAAAQGAARMALPEVALKTDPSQALGPDVGDPQECASPAGSPQGPLEAQVGSESPPPENQILEDQEPFEPEDGPGSVDMTAKDVTALSHLLKKGFRLVQSQPNHPLVGQLANVLKDVLPTSA